MKSRGREGRNHRAFTLLELMAVICVIVILMALLFSGISGVRLKSQQVQSLSNLKQITLAVNLFEMNMKELPAYQRLRVDSYSKAIPPRRGLEGNGEKYSWAVSLMPYVSNEVKTFWRPDTELGREWANNSVAEHLRYLENKYDGYIIRNSYSINARRYEGVDGYPFCGDYDRSRNTRNSTLVKNPSANLAFLGGGNWPNFGEGYESSLLRIHSWSNGKTDMVLMDGHAELRPKSSLVEKDFDYTK